MLKSISILILFTQSLTAMHMSSCVQKSLQKGITEMIQAGQSANLYSGAIMIYRALDNKAYEFIRADTHAMKLSAQIIEKVKVNSILMALFEKARISKTHDDWFAWQMHAAHFIKEQMKPYIIFPDNAKGRFSNRFFLRANVDFNAYMYAPVLRAGIYCLYYLEQIKKENSS